MSIKIKNVYVGDDERLDRYIVTLNKNIRIVSSELIKANRRIEYLENVVGKRFKKKE